MGRREWLRSTKSLVTELNFPSSTHISTHAHMYTYMFTSVDILKRQYVFSFCVHLHMNTCMWCLWVVCAQVYACAQRRDEELGCSALPQSTWFLWDSFFFVFHQTWNPSGGQQALAISLPAFALRSVQVTRMFSQTQLCPWGLRISASILTLIEQAFLPLEPSTLIWYYLLIFKTSENTIK